MSAYCLSHRCLCALLSLLRLYEDKDRAEHRCKPSPCQRFHEVTARQFTAIRPSSAKRSLGTMSKAHKQCTLEALELQVPQREQGPGGN